MAADNGNNSKPLSGPLRFEIPDSSGLIASPPRRPKCSVRFLRCFCAISIALLSVIAVVIFVTWLAIRPHKPRYHLDSGNVTSLAISNGTISTSMNFNISSRNPNERVGIFYDSMEALVIYDYVKIANASVPKFFQSQKNTTVVTPLVKGHSIHVDSGTYTTLKSESLLGQLKVEVKLIASIRFKVGRWTSRHYKMRVSCSGVVLDLSGAKPLKPEACLVYFWFYEISSFKSAYDLVFVLEAWGFHAPWFIHFLMHFSNYPVWLNNLSLDYEDETFTGEKFVYSIETL